MFNRIIGAIKADSSVFEEIENDQSATGQAAIVVAIAALLSALGSGIGASFSEQGGGFFLNFIVTLIMTFIGWLIWSAVVYFVGTSLFGGKADLSEMLRVIGFAYAPQFLGIIPCIGLLAGLWSLYVSFVAVRQGLDLDNMKAFLTVLIGFIVNVVIVVAVSMVLGLGAAGLGAISGGG